MKSTIKKAVSTIAAALAVITLAVPVGAYSTRSTGTFTDVKVSGTGYKVFFSGKEGSYYGCNFSVTKWSGSGTITVSLTCSNSSGIVEYSDTMSKADTIVLSGTYERTGLWNLDAKHKKTSGSVTISGNYSMF